MYGQEELTAQTWFEKGFNAADLDEKIRCYTEAIRLKPDFAERLQQPGQCARATKGDLDGALKDYAEAIRLKPDFADAYNNRGNARAAKGDPDGASKGLHRGDPPQARLCQGLLQPGPTRATPRAIWRARFRDYNEAIRLKPDFAEAFYNRGIAHYRQGRSGGRP